MLPRRYIAEWKEFAPWPEDAQVEQDLVIENALLQLYSDPFLRDRLAFRGGTALHKIYLKPQIRYSEDIDLVQIHGEPIKSTLEALRKQLDFLGNPSVKQKSNNNTLVYRFDSEIPPIVKMRLKIEINCREHFSVLGHKLVDFTLKNSWASGSCKLTAFEPEEMLGTKLRALYQRKKGRDLFDLYYALSHLDLDANKLVKCYNKYIAFSVAHPPTQKQFILNLEQKLQDPDFIGDIYALLRPGAEYNQNQAYQLIKTELLDRI